MTVFSLKERLSLDPAQSIITRVVHGTYLSVPFPSHSNLCLSHPMGRLPWDSHRNDIPMDKPRVVHGTYLSVPFPSHSNLCLSHLIPWDVSHGIPIGMTFPWISLGLSMGHIYLSHSHPIAIYACPIPWDSHRNDIPMDKPDYYQGHSSTHPRWASVCDNCRIS